MYQGDKKTNTYNRRDSQMVTHSSTSRPVQCLCMAERTGCPVFTDLWSYVTIPLLWLKIELSLKYSVRSGQPTLRSRKIHVGQSCKAREPQLRPRTHAAAYIGIISLALGRRTKFAPPICDYHRNKLRKAEMQHRGQPFISVLCKRLSKCI
jgi:hypothetical protein